jgi:predicted permease
VTGPDRDDVDAEVEFHLESRTRELLGRGLGEDEARAQARREFGDLEQARRDLQLLDTRVDARRSRSLLMNGLRQDLRYAWRRLRNAPGFAFTAMLTLALGIGVNTAILTVVHHVLLRPLPFPDADRLYSVYSANRSAGLLRANVSAVDLDDWRTQRDLIQDIGGYWYADGASGLTMIGRGAPRRLSGVFVEPGFFTTLGVRPVAGRLPRPDEMTRGGDDDVVVLGFGFWMREFGGDPVAIGQTLPLDGSGLRILGVLPADFRFPADALDVYVPFSTIPDEGIPRIRPVRVLRAIARAGDGVSAEQVQAEMNRIAERLAREYPVNQAWDEATVVPLSETVVGPVRSGLFILLGAAGLVLLMACVNVAGLQLARATGRGREIAVRLALGASRARLLRQLLTESLVLAVLGGSLGIAFAFLGLEALLALAVGQLPRSAEVSLDMAAVGFAAALSVITGVVFGLTPAWRLSGDGSAQQGLRDGSRGLVSAGHRHLRLALVVAEVAVVMVLIVGAGLMARSFAALMNVDPGFRPDGLLAVQFTIDGDRHSGGDSAVRPQGPGSGAAFTDYYEDVIEAVRHLPGVVSVGAVKDPPLRGAGERFGFRIPGRTVPAGQDPPSAAAMHVSYGYFATIGAELDGREFMPRDRPGAPLVFVVNEAFARQYFPGERAVGKRLDVGVPVEIVGVVGNIRQLAMAEPAAPTIYVHNLQNARVKTTLVVRAGGDPAALAGPVREAIWSIDPRQAITEVFTFDESVSLALSRPRLVAVLLGAFGVMGLALGALGIYGVVNALVGERRREIGVRLALGARPRDVLVMVVRGGLLVAAIGAAIGLGGAVALSRVLSAMLFDVDPVDTATYGGMAVVLLLTASLASYLPARRAARVDPVETLRE